MARATSAFRWVVIAIAADEEASDAMHVVCDRLQGFGHRVLEDLVVPPDHDELAGTLELFTRDPEVDMILTLGATGPGARDVAPEAAEGRIGKVLPGFGERFRDLAQDVMGASAWMERVRAATMPAPDAVKLLFQLPDDTTACELALADLVLPAAEGLFIRANPGIDLTERLSGGRRRTASGPKDPAGPHDD